MEIISMKVVKARKAHVCEYCLHSIQKGEVYNHDIFKDSSIYTFNSHVNCRLLAEKLNWFDGLDGLTSDGFEDSVDEYFYYAVPYSHIPVVKQFFTTRISDQIEDWEPTFEHKLEYLINKYLVEDKSHLCGIDPLEF